MEDATDPTLAPAKLQGSAGGFFALYELEDYGILTSAGYLERLNNPTPGPRG